ncbi:GntR family transcriptional regulator [Micromonospora kangleipakensis]|uniref:GntR family transcriptional regulator n=1 Tax=Micromonospora kangleipakensis TaxID=1077942 RepID=A0A4Q8BCT1_9ACTN|nr:GntR family transcriptional regulator [Micromonospora kangleipakensis]RZU74953.1 GntR family transcriptional regulator [Micromonospora kangleipakensis]
MAKRAGGESLAVSIYERLRLDILNRRLAPGERLKAAELSGSFDVSLSVIREALSLLAARDLVRVDRNRGFHVTSLSLEALNNLTLARKINEGVALRLSIERGGVAWQSEVLAAHHRMDVLPMVQSENPLVRNEEWARAHLAFHHKLIEACGNAVLLGICTRLSDAAELYRAWSTQGSREIKRDVAGEHRELLDAALAHDAERAVALFEAHVDRTRAIVMEFDPAALIGRTDAHVDQRQARRARGVAPSGHREDAPSQLTPGLHQAAVTPRSSG